MRNEENNSAADKAKAFAVIVLLMISGFGFLILADKIVNKVWRI
jgi:hypothetical protein